MGKNIKVTVWNENLHEKTDKRWLKHILKGYMELYPDFFQRTGLEVRTATLDQPERA